MPHFYFDIVEGEDRTLDEVGFQLADRAAARIQAIHLLIEIAREAVRDGDLAALAVEVRNEVGQPSFDAILRLEVRGED